MMVLAGKKIFWLLGLRRKLAKAECEGLEDWEI